jgi:hypothetical protein
VIDLEQPFDIRTPDDLRELIAAVQEALGRGRLEIVSGDLQWQDYMECVLRHTSTGRRYRLECETYHGSGGRWTPS